MAMPTPPEVWLRGPLPGFDAAVMPIAHGLVQVREDLAAALAGVRDDDLWARPGGAASAGYHLRHLAGSLGRLLTYARGERLSETQLAALAREGEPGQSTASLLAEVQAGIDRALEQIAATPATSLGETRSVGRKQLPATVLGLLVHAAEHSSRHTGQLITTLRIVHGSRTRAAAAD